MKKVIVNDYIVADPQICHGKPTFRGTRIMVWQILEMLEAGLSKKEIIKQFPVLTSQHIKAALNYASSLTREGYVIVNTQPPVPAG